MNPRERTPAKLAVVLAEGGEGLAATKPARGVCSIQPSSVQRCCVWLCTPAAGLLRRLLLRLLLSLLLLLSPPPQLLSSLLSLPPLLLLAKHPGVVAEPRDIISCLACAGERARHLPRDPLRHDPGERGVRRGGANGELASWTIGSQSCVFACNNMRLLMRRCNRSSLFV